MGKIPLTNLVSEPDIRPFIADGGGTIADSGGDIL